MAIDLYLDKVATTSRAVWLFCLENGIEVVLREVLLFKREHIEPDFTALNPNQMVPVIKDGNFVLSESAAILRYLASKTASPAYPRDLQKRAKVDEAIDWFNSQLYRDFGFNVVYQQLLPHHTRGSEEANRANVEWGCRQSARWLNLLDRRMIGAERDFVASDEISIADYFGASIVTLGEIVRLDFSPYPNVKRWLERMQALQHWNTVHDAFSNWAAALGPSYTAPSPAKHGFM